MQIYERRTYSIRVGQMAEAMRLYAEVGWPLFQSGGFSSNLVGYFVSDTGQLHQLMHIWRFADDAARRDFWKRLYGHAEFPGFASQVRALIEKQEVQLFVSAPWGPTP